jgi:serine/threonine protein phosphatase PrpC
VAFGRRVAPPSASETPGASGPLRTSGFRVDQAASDDGLHVVHGAPPRVDVRPDDGPWAPEVVDLAVTPFAPRPPSAEFYIPDLLLDGWETPELTLRLASVRGYGHRYGPAPRQDDAVAFYHAASGGVVIAVADGVGSAPRSHHGARHAVRVAAREVMNGLDVGKVPYWETIFDKVTESLERMADRMAAAMTGAGGPPPADAARLLGTTLLVALVRPVEGGLQADVAWAGDSGGWVLDEKSTFHPMIRSKTADGVTVVSSAVRALPQRPLGYGHNNVLLGPGDVLLLGTDGFGDPLGDGTGLVGELFARSLVTPPPPLRFAHLVDFSRETFDDDRTLVAVWPRSLARPDGRPVIDAEQGADLWPRGDGPDGSGGGRAAGRSRGLMGAAVDAVSGRRHR